MDFFILPSLELFRDFLDKFLALRHYLDKCGVKDTFGPKMVGAPTQDLLYHKLNKLDKLNIKHFDPNINRILWYGGSDYLIS